MSFLVGYLLICAIFSACYCFIGSRTWQREHSNQTARTGGGWSREPSLGL